MQEIDPTKFASFVAAKLEGINAERAPRTIAFRDAAELYSASMIALVVLLKCAQGNANKKEIISAARLLASMIVHCKQGDR